MVFRPVVVLAKATARALRAVLDYNDIGACAAGEYSGLLVDAALVFLPFVLLHFPAVPVVADDGGGLLRQTHRLEDEAVLSVHGLEDESGSTVQLPGAVR